MDAFEAKAAVRRTKDIDGWFAPEAGFLFALLNRVQRHAQVSGDIAEIGVHHGKSTVLLAAMIDRREERLIVCDVFGDQAVNLSASGRGDRAIFFENVADRFADVSFLDVHQKPSTELTVADVGRRCRFFHIDGGHSFEEAITDLRLAAECVSRGGTIVIDDAFNATWPAVSEAIVVFLREADSEFSPLVLGFNKLVLVRSSDRTMYRGLLDDQRVVDAYVPRPPYQLKRVMVNGSETLVFYVPTSNWRAARKARVHRWYFHRSDLLPEPARRAATWARRLLSDHDRDSRAS